MKSDPSYYTVSVASSEQFITKTVERTAHPALPQSVLLTDIPGSSVVTMAGQMTTYGHQPTCSLHLSDSNCN